MTDEKIYTVTDKKMVTIQKERDKLHAEGRKLATEVDRKLKGLVSKCDVLKVELLDYFATTYPNDYQNFAGTDWEIKNGQLEVRFYHPDKEETEEFIHKSGVKYND